MTKIKSYWLMKSEPDVYSYDTLVAEGEGTWDGVRIGLEIVGIIEITQSGIPDPTDETGRWACVKVKPVRKLRRPVTLKQIKADPALADIELVRLSRLSVGVITPQEWDYIIALSEA